MIKMAYVFMAFILWDGIHGIMQCLVSWDFSVMGIVSQSHSGDGFIIDHYKKCLQLYMGMKKGSA